MTTIPLVLKDCFKKFTVLLDSGHLVNFGTEVSLQRWEDELGRLRVWAANIGAHQTGQSSLDYRLRDASHIKKETVSLLQRLQDLLNDLNVLATEDGEFSTNDDNENEDIAEYHHKLCDNVGCSTTEVQEIYQSIVEVVNYLYQMSMAIRQPAQHDQLLGARSVDGTYFEPWAQQHVSHKYPNADNDLVARIGAAMARQKAVLKYRERHHMKLSQGIYGHDHPGTISSKLSETVATELVADKDHLQFLENASDSGISKTSYAATLMTRHGGVSVPQPPQSSNDRNPFECPYCFVIITIRDQKDWAHHVFRDLMPYVCIFPECSTPSRLYESRRRWFQHLINEHSLSSIPEARLTCPLCKSDIQQLRSLEGHVGRHLEELALFVLPSIEADPDDEEGGTKIYSASVSEPMRKLSMNSCMTPGYSSQVADKERNSSSAEEEDIKRSTAMAILTAGHDSPSIISEANSMKEKIARLEKFILDERTERESGNFLHQATWKEEASESVAREEWRAAEKRIADVADQKITAITEAEVEVDNKAAHGAAAATVEAEANKMASEKKGQIKFKDSVGRNFTFPFHLCYTWQVRRQEQPITTRSNMSNSHMIFRRAWKSLYAKLFSTLRLSARMLQKATTI